MNKKILGAVLGLGVLMTSAAASAHVDVAVGIGVPGGYGGGYGGGYYAPAQPVYVAPQPAYVGYGYGDGWREREWRREQWRHEQWRREHGRERRGYGY
jgi:hypothetical protein